jgi:hypothetical protein
LLRESADHRGKTLTARFFSRVSLRRAVLTSAAALLLCAVGFVPGGAAPTNEHIEQIEMFYRALHNAPGRSIVPHRPRAGDLQPTIGATTPSASAASRSALGAVQETVPQPGGRYAVGTALAGPCSAEFPLPLAGWYNGQIFHQRWQFWVLWDGDRHGVGAHYYIWGHPPNCVPLADTYYGAESTVVPTRLGSHWIHLATWSRDWRWDCVRGSCAWSDLGIRAEETQIFEFTVYEPYIVELRAWIPHKVTVDPLRPAPRPYWRDFGPARCSVPLRARRFDTIVSSWFHGDGHVRYDGAARVHARMDFEWDGTSIARMRHYREFGYTLLTTRYSAPAQKDRLVLPVYTCITAEKATEATRASSSPSSFTLEIKTANPLVPLNLGPNIDSQLTGAFDGTGGLTIRWKTDRFPSHGFRIHRRNLTLITRVVNDVSCLNVMGYLGAGTLLLRLNDQSNEGEQKVSPGPAQHEYVIHPCA